MHHALPLILALASCSNRTPPWTTPTAPPPVTITSGDLGAVNLTVDADIPLMVDVSFADPGAEAWIEYRFETDDWLIAPLVGPGHGVVLGLPADVDVDIRVAAEINDTTVYSGTGTIRTGSLPAILLTPTVTQYDSLGAYAAPYLMVSVAVGGGTWEGPYFVEIVDRLGRVVWYNRIPDGMFTLNPSVSLSGTHIWFEAENIFGFGFGEPSVTRRTLDGRWIQTLSVPDLGQAIVEGPDDSFYYEHRTQDEHGIHQLDPSGIATPVWDCGAEMEALGLESHLCLLNACNWNPTTNTLLASQFESATVFEVDVASGAPVRQFGQLAEGRPFTFDPPDSTFAYQHHPHYTPRGTLLVSTHEPCGSTEECAPHFGKEGVQVAAEYEIDDANQVLRRIGMLRTTDLWATQAGEAFELPNGNLVLGFGQDGALREYTPEGDVVWQGIWPRDRDDYRAIGHATLITDLYALNVGAD